MTMTASEMGKLSWKKRREKYSPEELKELLSRGRKGKKKLVKIDIDN